MPLPTITWDHDGVDIVPRGNIEIKTTDKETTLSISKITKEYAGKYTVVATNELGHESASITINILSKYCLDQWF